MKLKQNCENACRAQCADVPQKEAASSGYASHLALHLRLSEIIGAQIIPDDLYRRLQIACQCTCMHVHAIVISKGM